MLFNPFGGYGVLFTNSNHKCDEGVHGFEFDVFIVFLE